MLRLKEDTHQYIDDETNEEYTSVSVVLSQFKKPFDSEYWAEKKAKDYGTSKDEVLSLWEEVKDTACFRGKNYHKLMEDFILFDKRETDADSLYNSFSRNLDKMGDGIITIDAEKLLYNTQYKVAGTADVIINHSGREFSIMDFKTNRQFRYFSKYKEFLLPPIDHLQACEFNNYTMQLSLYAYMYSIMSGKTCRSLAINFLNKDTQEWEHIPVNFMKYEAMLLLRSYKPILKLPVTAELVV